MSRTADPTARQRMTISSLGLLIIALCLVAHFLVEDVSLQQALDPSSQNRSAAGLAFDEMGHQDDLALTAHLPESIPPNEPPAVPAWTIQLERQPAFPIRIPPKIA